MTCYRELALIAGGNAECYSHLVKTVWRFLTKLNIALPYDSAIAFLGIYPKELKYRYTQKPTRECLQQLYSLPTNFRLFSNVLNSGCKTIPSTLEPTFFQSPWNLGLPLFYCYKVIPFSIIQVLPIECEPFHII